MLELLPSPRGQVEFLAGASIPSPSKVSYDGVGEFPATMPIVLSGMSNSPELLPNPFRPAWSSESIRIPLGSMNEPVMSGNSVGRAGSYLTFQRDTAMGRLLEGSKIAGAYLCHGGDILGLSFGAMSWQGQTPIYMGSGSADIRASRDIIHLDTVPATGVAATPVPSTAAARRRSSAGRSRPGGWSSTTTRATSPTSPPGAISSMRI